MVTITKVILSGRTKRLIGLFILLVFVGAILKFTPLGQKVPLPQFVKNVVTPQSDKAQKAKETKELLAKIGHHMILPAGEEPVVAIIKDKELLAKEQKFYQDAQNGDYLVVYPKAAKAIIYSPKLDVLVNVGPLIGQAPTPTPEPQVNQKSPLMVEIRNGTGKSGLAGTIKQRLETNGLFKITEAIDAGKKDYEKTIIVDTGKTNNKEAVKQLSGMLGAQIVGNLPAGEKETSAEVLVILGKDQL